MDVLDITQFEEVELQPPVMTEILLGMTVKGPQPRLELIVNCGAGGDNTQTFFTILSEPQLLLFRTLSFMLYVPAAVKLSLRVPVPHVLVKATVGGLLPS